MKRKLFLVFLILLTFPLVSAVNYGSGTYGLGVYGGEEAGDITPPGGGGGSGCTYNWECTNWFPSECPESETRERICANKGTCTGTTGMPKQTQICEYTGPTEPIFDIFLTLSDKDKEVCTGEKIGVNIRLENYGKLELLDAFMTYWILDKNNTLISELKDTRSVKDEINFNIEMKIPESSKQGTYRLYAQIDYDKNKTAVAGESFEIVEGEQCKIYFSFTRQVLLIAGAGIFLVVIFLIFYLKKKSKEKSKLKGKESHAKYKKRIGKNLRDLKN
ncbi:hypothetical protein LCGC14_1482970 [marine sediment metagenome]|uniref:CARDB domain-containing protein n=1 Tax=marine sediment metagenome TaxID=412755 RepID=A0A0F9JUW2_9ZZZZ